MKNTLCISFLALSLTVGCGADTSDPQNPQGTPDAASGGGSSEPSINGEPASQYYSRFIWETTKSHNSGVTAFTATNGRDMYLVDFYLNKNQSFIAYYVEGNGEVFGTEYSMRVAPETKKKITGTWRIARTTLELGTFMSCEGTLHNDKPMMRCKLTAPVGSVSSPAALQAAAIVGPHFVPSSPSDSQWTNYPAL